MLLSVTIWSDLTYSLIIAKIGLIFLMKQNRTSIPLSCFKLWSHWKTKMIIDFMKNCLFRCFYIILSLEDYELKIKQAKKRKLFTREMDSIWVPKIFERFWKFWEELDGGTEICKNEKFISNSKSCTKNFYENGRPRTWPWLCFLKFWRNFI